MSNRTLSTPDELRDFCIGKQIYQSGGQECDCTTSAMILGFYRALVADRGSQQEDSFATTYNRGGLKIYHDRYANWIIVEKDGDPILDTRPAWNAASAGVYPGKAIYPKTNSGYDYESRRNPNEQVPSIQ